MDDIVKAALRKWPNVPACRGWLGLDARGQWYLRDEATQAGGSFPAAKGSLIDHPGLRDFIQRNYMADDEGAWFFQNGPQRVYVELEAAPLVWRLALSESGELTMHSHCDQPARQETVLSDEHGRVYIAADLGFGIVHSLDTPIVAEQVERGVWDVEAVASEQLPRRFGFVRSPAAAAPAR